MNTALKRISKLAKLQIKYEDEVEKAEANLKQAKENLRKVAEVDLPEAMESVEMEEFKLEDGSKIKIDTKYQAGISAANTAKAFAWLRKHNLDSMIKHQVTVEFGKGEDKKAKAALKLMQTKGYRHKDKQSVHNQTLKAFVREQLEAGADLPLDLFGVVRQTVAKITRPAH